MILGLRVRGSDVGALFNILFYTPVGFIITLSIVRLLPSSKKYRNYCFCSLASFMIILFVFIIGVLTNRSLHIGFLLYVMVAVFFVTMVYFIIVHQRTVRVIFDKVRAEIGSDIVPYERYSKFSSMLMCLNAALLPISILSNTILLFIGPFLLFTVVCFVQSFISIGFNLISDWGSTVVNAELEKEEDADEPTEEERASTTCLQPPSVIRMRQIEEALAKWCEEKRYQDSGVTIFSLAENIGCKKSELTEYFNQSAHTNFRTWLSDIRFNEAVRMMKACPNYSNDAISIGCGFSSHTQIYRLFKQKTGLSPSQWREKLYGSSC